MCNRHEQPDLVFVKIIVEYIPKRPRKYQFQEAFTIIFHHLGFPENSITEIQ